MLFWVGLYPPLEKSGRFGFVALESHWFRAVPLTKSDLAGGAAMSSAWD